MIFEKEVDKLINEWLEKRVFLGVAETIVC